jgi:hypothetical protein
LADHVIRQALAAANQLVTLGDLAAVLLAGQHRDALCPGVVAKPLAGKAQLVSTAGAPHGLM